MLCLWYKNLMTEKRACEKDTKKRAEKEIEKAANETENWAEDQKKRGYYYDDAHGYEVYEPDEDEEEK
jgi:hypothetical protein